MFQKPSILEKQQAVLSQVRASFRHVDTEKDVGDKPVISEPPAHEASPPDADRHASKFERDPRLDKGPNNWI